MSALLTKTVRDQKRTLIGWAIGVAAMTAIYVSFYPTIRGSAASLDKYMQTLPEAVKQIIGREGLSSPAGYLRSEIFSLLGPILFLVFAIGSGARAIAGEEETGTLDLLLSTPIRRSRLLLDKAIVILLTCAGLAAVVWATICVLIPVAGMKISAVKIGAACMMLLLVALTFGSIALAIGCLTGRRGTALAITSGFGVFAFMLNALAPVVPVLKPLRPISPFRWYLEPDPLIGGLHAANVLVLACIIVAAVAISFTAFDRRDLTA